MNFLSYYHSISLQQASCETYNSSTVVLCLKDICYYATTAEFNITYAHTWMLHLVADQRPEQSKELQCTSTKSKNIRKESLCGLNTSSAWRNGQGHVLEDGQLYFFENHCIGAACNKYTVGTWSDIISERKLRLMEGEHHMGIKIVTLKLHHVWKWRCIPRTKW